MQRQRRLAVGPRVGYAVFAGPCAGRPSLQNFWPYNRRLNLVQTVSSKSGNRALQCKPSSPWEGENKAHAELLLQSREGQMEWDGARAAAGGWEAEGSAALAGGMTAAWGEQNENVGCVVRDSPSGRRADFSVLHKRVSSLPASGAAAKQAVCMRTRSVEAAEASIDLIRKLKEGIADMDARTGKTLDSGQAMLDACGETIAAYFKGLSGPALDLAIRQVLSEGCTHLLQTDARCEL